MEIFDLVRTKGTDNGKNDIHRMIVQPQLTAFLNQMNYHIVTMYDSSGVPRLLARMYNPREFVRIILQYTHNKEVIDLYNHDFCRKNKRATHFYRVPIGAGDFHLYFHKQNDKKEDLGKFIDEYKGSFPLSPSEMQELLRYLIFHES